MDLTDQDLIALIRQGDLGPYLRQATEAAHAENERRRRLVLRFPDLAVRLTQPPIGHATPEHWTGYIPPETTCTGAINDSPARPALLALVAEAEARAGQTVQRHDAAA